MMKAMVVSYNHFDGLSVVIDGIVYNVIASHFLYKPEGTMVEISWICHSARRVKLA